MIEGAEIFTEVHKPTPLGLRHISNKMKDLSTALRSIYVNPRSCFNILCRCPQNIKITQRTFICCVPQMNQSYNCAGRQHTQGCAGDHFTVCFLHRLILRKPPRSGEENSFESTCIYSLPRKSPYPDNSHSAQPEEETCPEATETIF